METQPMTNKEKQRLHSKKYREASRDVILAKKAEYRKLMRKCSCGEVVSRNNHSRHIKQKKHSQLLQDQEVIKEEDVVYVDTIEEVKEEATRTVEEPLLEITEEEMKPPLSSSDLIQKMIFYGLPCSAFVALCYF